MHEAVPVVLEGLTSIELINYVLNLNLPATIIACCTKEDFISELTSVCPTPSDSSQTDGVDGDDRDVSRSHAYPTTWHERTLRMISTAGRLSMVFCSEVGQLRAFLATYHLRDRQSYASSDKLSLKPKVVAIMNIINLHRSTLSFSAQGFNRTLAAVVDAAFLSEQKLILAECVSRAISEHGLDTEDRSDVSGVTADANPVADPWSEAVSMLNVTTKSFGVGERGWSGRTVTLRSIAHRWFVFHKPKAAV